MFYFETEKKQLRMFVFYKKKNLIESDILHVYF